MATQLYVSGNKSSDGQHIVCPLPSSCVLFFLRYCQTNQFHLTFLHTKDSSIDDLSLCKVSLSAVDDIPITFLPWEDAPNLVRNVSLPCVHQPAVSLIRAGLCVTLRHLIKAAHAEAPTKCVIDLLGFRQGSMRMCAEVSGWTKLCEVELSNSISQVICTLRELKRQSTSSTEKSLDLPLELLKLEGHFKKKCRVHNDDKKKRAELLRLKDLLSSMSDVNGIDSDQNGQITVHSSSSGQALEGDPRQKVDACIEKLNLSQCQLEVQHVVYLAHGVRRMEVNKTLGRSCQGRSSETAVSQTTDSSLASISSSQESHAVSAGVEELVPDLAKVIERLTYLDLEYVHTYSEGPEMTLADLILFVYFYFLLESLDFDCGPVAAHIPSILQWAAHMISLPTVSAAALSMGWDVSCVVASLKSGQSSQAGHGNSSVSFLVPKEPENNDEDEMELSRCARMKHKAIKPEVFQAVQKLEMAQIQVLTGDHPRGQNVQVDWDSLPAGVHPKEGDVPEKRTRRKCQQLENLVTAVLALARPRDVLIDFCCGGGHLGIVLAHLLPDCQVYLVENKEESLLKACSRLEALALKNVTLYQCNMDYFIGKFDVGFCLHACGSATDMVLQLCLDAAASFVICPCCYGSIHRTHLLNYPRSKQFQNSTITYKDFLTLGHAADQTEFNIALEGQGRKCMNLVDSDRAEYARELGYQVTLCSLQPLSCTPKNNLLVGTPA